MKNNFLTTSGRGTLARVVRSSALLLTASVAMLVAATLPASASMRAHTSQTKLSISNTVLKGEVGVPLTVKATGGSGTGAVTFTTTGLGCAIVASTGVLTDTKLGTCSVVASKAASGTYAKAMSAAVDFVFGPGPQAALKITNTVTKGQVGVILHVTASGGSGTGAVTYNTTGSVCSINSATGAILAGALGSCPVTVSKAASGVYQATTSPAVVFTFSAGPQPTLTIANSPLAGYVGEPVTVFTAGGAGAGAVTYTVSGTGCSIGASTGVLSDTAAGECSVVATKAASDTYLAVTSAAAVFTFSPSSGGGSVENPTYLHPDTAVVTSITGTVNSEQVDDTVNGVKDFIQKYYSPGDHWYENYITDGAVVKMTWHVTGSYGQALANTTVTLASNLAYSNSNGITWAQSSMNANPGSSANPLGVLAGVTDGSGNVTFTFTNTNTNGSQLNAPADTTTTTTAEAMESTNPFTSMVLMIGTPISNTASKTDVFTAYPSANPLVNQATDRVDFILIPAAGGNQKQATLKITNSSLSVAQSASVTVTTSGGSGTGALTYAVTGTHCSITAQGVVTASAATTCSVTVTKAASTGYSAATSAAAVFTFGTVAQQENPTFANPDKAVLTSATGAVNSSIIDNTANGDAWFISQYYSPSDHWGYYYVNDGATVVVTWHVTGSYGQSLAHQTVTLETGFATGKNNAVSFTSTGMSAGGNVSGTTDGSGNVSFTLTVSNTNGASQAAPGDTTSATTANNMEGTNPWSRLVLVVGTATGTYGSATDVFSANPASPTVNQATDLVDFILIPAAG